MGHFVDHQGNYYTGDRQGDDLEVPARPSPRHKWNGGWVLDHALMQQHLTDAIQAYLDAVAQTRGYDGILSLCSYAGASHAKFKPEGRAGCTFRDACWDHAYQVLDDCLAGRRTTPTPEELLAEMPVMVWPLTYP